MSEQDGQRSEQPPRRVREGWDESFAGMAQQGDDEMLDEITLTSWDKLIGLAPTTQDDPDRSGLQTESDE